MDELFQEYKREVLKCLDAAENNLYTQGSTFQKTLNQIENLIQQMQLEASNLPSGSYNFEIKEIRDRYIKLLQSKRTNSSVATAAQPLLDGFAHLSESRAIVDEVNSVNRGVLEELFAQRLTIGNTISRLIFQGDYINKIDGYMTKLQINRNLHKFVFKFIAALAIAAVFIVVPLKLI